MERTGLGEMAGSLEEQTGGGQIVIVCHLLHTSLTSQVGITLNDLRLPPNSKISILKAPFNQITILSSSPFNISWIQTGAGPVSKTLKTN